MNSAKPDNSIAEVERLCSYFFNGLELTGSGAVQGLPKLSRGSLSLSDCIRFVLSTKRPSHVKNADLFYSLLYSGYEKKFKWASMSELQETRDLPLAEFPYRLLEEIFSSRKSNSFVLDQLETSILEVFTLTDEELVKKISEEIVVDNYALEESSNDVVYTKINHGYWEFLLNTFVNIGASSLFRDLSGSAHPQSMRESGFHEALFQAIEYVTKEPSTNSNLKLGISICAGDKPFSQSISSTLSKPNRGAMVGLLGFLDALQIEGTISLVDGSAPRDLLKDNTYPKFFENVVGSSSAILLLVPSGLTNLEFPQYAGVVNVMTLPGQLVHETYRVLIPTIIGYIEELLSVHEKIVVITQSAVFAPLLSIYINTIFCESRDRLSFFDMGRVLDIARLDALSPIASLAWVAESGLDLELEKYFRLRNADQTFSLISKVSY